MLHSIAANIPFWLGPLIAMVAIASGAIWLHEAQPFTRRWYARSSVYVLGIVGVAISFIQQLDSHSVIQSLTQQQEAMTNRVVRAESVANAAALKSHVFRLPVDVADGISSALAKAPPRTVSISCAPGLETVCSDLSEPFLAAKWRTSIHRGAAFFTGGGLDAAVPDPQVNTGIYVTYRNGNESIAADISKAIKLPGVRVATRGDQTPGGADISIGVLFVTI